ncbi:MAG: 4'-phosphopantetheinyl transferase superfamily protein [Steroidobacteraceae bacterium]
MSTHHLDPGVIELWCVFYDRITDERLHQSYRGLMNAAERKQEVRFHFENDRRRYLLTRALVRTVLSRYAGVAPGDWTFATNEYGRPEISNVEALGAELSFNISHTRSLIVLGVTRGRALGVDVENIATRSAPIDVADRYFASDEVAALAAAGADQQHYRFFEYWTFKESYIKARGMGLSIPLDKFSFSYPSDTSVSLALQPELADDAKRWHLWQFQPSPEYLVAVCAERSGANLPRVVVREAVPTVSDEAMVLAPLRTSFLTLS